MSHNEHTSKTPSPRTGIFALLSNLLRVKGTGARKISQGTGASKTGLRLVLSVFATTLGALAFASAPALAASGHVFSGEFKGTPGHELSDPTGVAVNNATGDVYVVSKGNSRVVEFNPTGTTVIAEFGTSGELTEPEAIAIDNSGKPAAADPSVGDVYVTDHNVVDKFSSAGKYEGQITGTCEKEGEVPPSCSKSKFVAFEELEGVAVDPKGQVWVYQANKNEGGSYPASEIYAFSDAQPNVFLSSRKAGAGELSISQPGLAVDSEDDLYVAHGKHFDIAKLNSEGKVLRAAEEEGSTGIAVESISNDVYIDAGNPEENTPEVQVYTPGGFAAGEPPIETFGETQLADHGGTGLAVSYADISSGDVYVVDSTEGKVDMFIPAKATAYAESFHFGGNGTGSGEFTEPLGIAVNDATEDVYVVDKGNKRVEELEKDGHFIAEFNGSGLNPNEGPGSPIGTYPGRFENPESVAVDNDPSSESYGDVYVTDKLPGTTYPDPLNGGEPVHVSPGAVYKFEADGAYLGQLRRCPEDQFSGGFESERCVSAGEPTAGFTFGLTGVAVTPEGNVWVGTNYSSEAFNKFSDTGTYIESSGSPTSLGSAGGGLVAGSSALDPLTGQLFADRESGIDRYSSGEESPAALLESFPAAGGLTDSHGIAVSPAHTVYATERTAGEVEAFDEFPLPQVAVGAVSSLRPTSVTLEGAVNPEGLEVSSCEFEYGATASYGQVVPCEQGLGEAPGEIGKGTEPVLVSAKLSGLPSGTTYHYRLVAGNHAGTHSGSDHVFTTPGPSITEEQVTYVEAKTATLQATIDPDGDATSYHFEYDTTPYTEGEAAHGTSLPVPSAAIGAGTSPVPVSVKAQGLEPGKTYYYRAVAEGEPLGAPESFYGTGETFATPGSAPAQSCPNEQLRAEQPFGLTLPDCRAYEMVSPAETDGQDATDSFIDSNARAAVSGANPAITYASKGSFGNPTGATATDQFVSRRNAEEGRWETQAVTPLWNPQATHPESSFAATVFTPELTVGIATTDASLPSSGAPNSFGSGLGLYVSDFATGSYRYVAPRPVPWGASTDLSRVLLTNEENESLLEWVEGADVPVSVANTGEELTASAGSAQPAYSLPGEKDAWHATSEDGSRVYYTTPANLDRGLAGTGVGQLYVRVNVGQPQSPLADGEANGTGTLTAGSATVTSLVAATGVTPGETPEGATEINVSTRSGRFVVGATISGSGIAPGTTIKAISGGALTLSSPTTAKFEGGSMIESSGPAPFAVGQKITGNGIPQGTTIIAADKAGELTLSAPAAASGTAVALVGGGECTVVADACTVEVSASQRFLRANPAGTQAARYWGASADGSKVFFTSDAELTEDAYTGPGGNAANLYEYDIESGKLTDLTGEGTDNTGNGAAVQGVVQISEDGSYVYFVADGKLAAGAVQGEPNLYVSHEGGAPVFVATLEPGDKTDWQGENVDHGGEFTASSPEDNTAVVNPGGSRLAFSSERSLTGYDNEQAQPGGCEQLIRNNSKGEPEDETGRCREIFLYDAETSSLVCASCNPAGARPLGRSSLASPSSLASNAGGSDQYRPRDLLEDGSLFFDSSDALVPHAKDGRQNVYEYEDGDLHAISDVAGDYESFFLDASASGEDVFFGSADKLLTQDTGDNVDVWDARQDGGFPVAPAAPSCGNADSCKPPASPQPAVFGTPASATFAGPGNPPPPPSAVVTTKKKTAAELKAEKLTKALKQCKKDKQKAKRKRCEASARKKYAPAKPKQKAKKSANTNRRASR